MSKFKGQAPLFLIPHILHLLALCLSFAAPFWLLRALWATYSASLIPLVALWYGLADSNTFVYPWLWILQPTAVGYALVASRWPVAVLYTVALSLSVPLLSLAFRGAVTPPVIAEFFIHLGNIAFIAIFALIRAHLTMAFRASRAEQQSFDALAEAEAEAHEQRMLGGIVHDEVLATIAAASLLRGSSPETLRQAAASALVALEETIHPRATAKVSATEFALELTARVKAIDSETTVAKHIVSRDQTIDSHVAKSISAAVFESVRNASNHARDNAIKHVRIHVAMDSIVVTIVDNGVGFDLQQVGPNRFGVAFSILRRMSDVSGGYADIETTPAGGTTVTVGWRALA